MSYCGHSQVIGPMRSVPAWWYAVEPRLEVRRHELLRRGNDILDVHLLTQDLEAKDIADLVACTEEQVDVVLGVRGGQAETHSRSD